MPWRIALALVDELGSGVTLRRPRREGLLERQTDSPPAPGDVRRRLNDVLQLEARTSVGESLGRVLDVRLRTVRREPLELVAEGLVVGRGRPGGYLGYDRDGKQGPWLLNRLVRRIHRHSGYVPMADVGPVDWDEQTVRIEVPCSRSTTRDHRSAQLDDAEDVVGDAPRRSHQPDARLARSASARTRTPELPR